MAYLVELVAACRSPGCTHRAVVEVRDRWNGSLGSFCRAHGQRRLAEETRIEQRAGGNYSGTSDRA